FTATGKAVHLAADLHDVAAPGLKQAKLVAKADAPALSGPYAITADLADGANHVSAAAQLRLEKEMAVTLSRTTGIWAGQDFALTAPATLRMADGAFTLDETHLALGKGSLVLAANGGGENLTANVRLQSLPAAPVAALLGLGKAGGTISFDADVAVSKTESQGRFHFGANDLVFAGYKKDANKADIAADGSWNGQTLALNGKISGIGSEPATFDGNLPVVRTPGSYMPMLAKSGPVSFRARLRAPAENLMAVLPVAEHRLSGAIDAQVDVGGDIAQPAISGSVTVKDGVYENLEYGTRLTKLNAAFTARGTDQAAIKLTASDGDDGTVVLDGNLRFGKGTETEKPITGEGKLVLNNARLLREDALKARASGTITLALPPQGESKVSGTIRVNEVRADITGLIPPSIPFIEVVEINGKQVTPPEPAKPSMLNTIALDITVNMPNRVYVAGRGLDSEWQGDFHITGSLGAPKPSGKLTVVRGTAELIGKTFVLKSGSVVLDKEVNGGATVDLAAEYASDDLTVKVNAEGPAAKPELTWSSTPSLPRDEILSRLFFGKSSPHLSAFEALQLAQMSGQLDFMGGSSGGGLMGMARSVAGLDVLRVDTAPFASGLSGTSVAADKYIGDNIYVGAVQGMGAGSSAVEVEIKLNKHLSGKA
ncbi:MAG: translocation/assembly module TamB domain-containing protein, partial [Alphaproteobacteria bacterium]|nr:translocation/assembly module TamB domain-containing protein [Alphaproteobacteria bacterium]